MTTLEVSAGTATGSPAVLCILPSFTVLRKRADFLRAAHARRQSTPGFLLQARKRVDGEPACGIRIGYTCSKKLGNAVVRNRAKRRLRAAAHQVLSKFGEQGWDYVLVGRHETTTTRDFALLASDLETALKQIHAKS